MEYITVKEAARKWGVSERRTQQMCNDGKVVGATKLGNSWAIPLDAEMPDILRKAKGCQTEQTAPKETNAPVGQPMPLLNTPFLPGECMKQVSMMEDDTQRSIAMAEYAYFSGKATRASQLVEPYLTHESIPIRLSACFIYAYSNLALDRIDQTRVAIEHVHDVVSSLNEDTSDADRAIAVCVNTGMLVLLHLPLPENLPSMKAYIAQLPPGLRLFALYVQAHQAYLRGEYWSSIGIVETALVLEGTTYPISSIYLHLVATMDYMSLRHSEEAKEHLLAAWALAQPDDLLEPFGEHHGLVGGVLEATLKKDFPDDFRRIISITYQFSAGWRKIHNPDTGHSVADNLTTTEFATAMLAARDWSNKEIASHLGIAENTVKKHIAVVLSKLHVAQRKELKAFMLK